MPDLYRISFVNQGEIFEIYARSVRSADVFGFVEIADFVFGERSSVLVDPAEEKLESAFSGVRRSLVPMHSVVRIDQVDKRGKATISPAGESSNVTPFPVFTGGGKPSSTT